jgi:hypothetical protein
MTATLSVELDGRVPPGLIAEIVRAVLDESRQTAQDRAVEIIMLEARQRLERFIRARASRWARGTMAQRWSELSQRKQTAILVAASVQLSLAATAWADLSTRPAELVNGRKTMWAAIITVNFVGPIAYFARGRLPRSWGDISPPGSAALHRFSDAELLFDV